MTSKQNLLREDLEMAKRAKPQERDWISSESKKLKFEHMNKLYMQNPESVLENETRKILLQSYCENKSV